MLIAEVQKSMQIKLTSLHFTNNLCLSSFIYFSCNNCRHEQISSKSKKVKLFQVEAFLNLGREGLEKFTFLPVLHGFILQYMGGFGRFEASRDPAKVVPDSHHSRQELCR